MLKSYVVQSLGLPSLGARLIFCSYEPYQEISWRSEKSFRDATVELGAAPPNRKLKTLKPYISTYSDYIKLKFGQFEAHDRTIKLPKFQ